MQEFLRKCTASRYTKYYLMLLVILLLYATPKIYFWSFTQSTDNAYVESDISIISPEVSGIITHVFVTNNQKLIAGDIIAKINDKDYKANIAIIESSINSSLYNTRIIAEKIIIAKLNLEQSMANLEFSAKSLEIAKREYARTKDLYKEKFSSKKIFDDASVALDKSANSYIQTNLVAEIAKRNLGLLEIEKLAEEEKLRSLMENKKISERSLANTEIKAIVSGTLSNSNLQVGNFARASVPLFSIVQDKLYIKANFKETQISKISPKFKVEISFDTLANQKFTGTVRNISPATGSKFSLIQPDNATGNFTKIVQRVPVLIDFELPKDVNLIAGMSAKVSIRTDQKIND